MLTPEFGTRNIGRLRVVDQFMDRSTTFDATMFTRRELLASAAMIGATPAWAEHPARPRPAPPRERRDLFPEGVASGDPDCTSVLVWTRRPYTDREDATLRVEISRDVTFETVVATAKAKIAATADWTCRVLVGNLEPAQIFWYRFIDDQGNASRVGRTLTAPARDDPRPVNFAFVCCQNLNMGEQHAYRRMIYDDERAPKSQQIEFVLHLGDFIYEVVWYPEDRPQGLYGRKFRDILRYPDGERIADFHIPRTVRDYRTAYRAYLHDPDLQDARAHWPFVCIWDNHEFSWNGWQSVQIFGGKNRPAQTRKVAANQAWFEYQPARVKQAGAGLDHFNAPQVQDVPIERFDSAGRGDEPNNLAAIGSLTAYRAVHWGPNVELILTDQRSYRSEEPAGRTEANALSSEHFPELVPQEAMEILDAGSAYRGGQPPATIRIGAREIPNFRKDAPPQSILGAEQKIWFLQRLRSSEATWKIWGNTLGTLDYRADPQNLPAGLTLPWPGTGYACFRGGDASTAYVERAEIYAAVQESGITGFTTIAGDRHSFWAGLAAPSLPPEPFNPVGIAFVVGSISAPGLAEKLENGLPATHPLHSLYLHTLPGRQKPERTVNTLLRHGVRSCLEYARTGSLARARAQSNPQLAPHLSFLDLGGHGYAIVRASDKQLDCEFICIPHPSERLDAADGGPVNYRVVHSASLWKKGSAPKLEQRVLEGDPGTAI